MKQNHQNTQDAKSPNGPSLPTPPGETPNCQPVGGKGVRCSAWLGDVDKYGHPIKYQIVNGETVTRNDNETMLRRRPTYHLSLCVSRLIFWLNSHLIKIGYQLPNKLSYDTQPCPLSAEQLESLRCRDVRRLHLAKTLLS
jgi:hypothetical protein